MNDYQVVYLGRQGRARKKRGKGGGVGMGIDTHVTKSEGFLVHRASLI